METAMRRTSPRLRWERRQAAAMRFSMAASRAGNPVTRLMVAGAVWAGLGRLESDGSWRDLRRRG